MYFSSNVMDSIDLLNGVLEEEGMKIQEKCEKQSRLLLTQVKSQSTFESNKPAKANKN